MLEATGERLLPDQQRGQLVHAEHVARYRFAAQFAQGCDVLDAASGEGYGTAMLAAAGAARIVGVDNDAKTVAHATEKYGLEFEKADVSELPFEDASFDLVVSFETIEHVKDQSGALAEFRRVLRPRGRLVISTPNRDEYLMDSGYHTREFNPSEFARLLSEQFSSTLFVYQQNWLVSAVLGKEQFGLEDEQKALDIDLRKVTGQESGKELYSIAICGESEKGPVQDVGVLTAVYEAHQLGQRTEQAENLLETWTARAEEAERLVEAWNERALEAERQLAQKVEKLDAVESSLSWRITRPLRSAKQGLGRVRD